MKRPIYKDCNKKSLTREAAISALALIKSHRRTRAKDKKPKRMYYCQEHQAWHLTSQSASEFYKSKKTNKKFR